MKFLHFVLNESIWYTKNDLFSQCRASLVGYFVKIVFRGRIVCKSVGKGTDLIQSSPNKSFQIQGLLFWEKFSGAKNSQEFPFQTKSSLPSLGSFLFLNDYSDKRLIRSTSLNLRKNNFSKHWSKMPIKTCDFLRVLPEDEKSGFPRCLRWLAIPFWGRKLISL